MPPHAHLVQEGHEVDPDHVQGELDEHDQAHRHELAGQPCLPKDCRRIAVRDARVGEQGRDDRAVDEARGGVVDAGHDGELADEIEPRRPPAPVLVLHPGRPVVQTASGGIGRGDLTHGRRDQ